MESNSENGYFLNSDSAIELVRLQKQAALISRAMKGVRTGWPELPGDAKILDLACGPGDWVLEVAYELPKADVCGVDISRTMTNYARARATSRQVFNASFGIMDITQHLDFADSSFDLVHGRFLIAVLKQGAWAPLIAECTRILRPGGFLQMVEGDDAGRSLSPALERLNNLSIQALWKAGYGFSPDGHTFGMAPGLLRLFKQAGYLDLDLSTAAMDRSASSDGWADFRDNQKILLQEIKSVVVFYGLSTSEEFDDLLLQATAEMYQDDFTAVGYVVSMIGRKQGDHG